MTSWTGTATLLSTHKDKWRGTLIMLGQPAEERVAGAVAMLHDGLLARFPRPDFIIAIHDDSGLPSGTVGYISGPAHANVDSVDVTIFGRGGHGAQPQNTVDPIVIAARTVLSLQTLVSRENSPLDPAVITVGSIHGGSKHNIIPDSVHLQITVRSYGEDVQKRLISGIERIAKAEAMAANAPREPEIKLSEPAHVMVNDPQLTARLVPVLKRASGDQNVIQIPPKMVSEDFSEYGSRRNSSHDVLCRCCRSGKIRCRKGFRNAATRASFWDLRSRHETDHRDCYRHRNRRRPRTSREALARRLARRYEPHRVLVVIAVNRRS